MTGGASREPVEAAAFQTLWAEQLAATLVDANVAPVVISPGSRSTPLVIALARAGLETVTLVDERAAAFFALGAARATGRVAALVCTSGSAAAHYLPALVEAATAGVPLLVLTADRPPELHDCGASQTIDQRAIYGTFVRGAFDLGAPAGGELGLRAVRRKLVQAITLARGPVPGPVHVDVPLRKPLEPVAPSTDAERALARGIAERAPVLVAPPRLAPDPAAVTELARAIAAEPRGLVVAGALPVGFAAARELVFELARLSGYPIVAEAGSQLRFGPRPDDVTFVDHFDLVAAPPAPALILQLGAEPVAAAWPALPARVRWVVADTWRDPAQGARVVLGDPAATLREVVAALRGAPDELALTRARRAVERASASLDWVAGWLVAERTAAAGIEAALAAHPDSEAAALRAAVAALPPGAVLQLGNSLPIRVVDQVCTSAAPHPVITQRGAAGIDGLVASAAGATRAGAPVLLVLGDVSFAHDLGGLLAARAAAAPLAILVVDNGGGQIFAGLPVARAELGDAFADHWLTAPAIDPAAVATALGARGVVATTPASIAHAVAAALDPARPPGATVIHAPVSTSGAHEVRRLARAHAAAHGDRPEVDRTRAIGGPT